MLSQSTVMLFCRFGGLGEIARRACKSYGARSFDSIRGSRLWGDLDLLGGRRPRLAPFAEKADASLATKLGFDFGLAGFVLRVIGCD